MFVYFDKFYFGKITFTSLKVFINNTNTPSSFELDTNLPSFLFKVTSTSLSFNTVNALLTNFLQFDLTQNYIRPFCFAYSYQEIMAIPMVI